MSTPNAQSGPARRAGPRALAPARLIPAALMPAALLAAGALAAGALAGCGTSQAGSPSGGTTPTASSTAPAASATSVAAGAPAATGASATPPGSATPVPPGSATSVPPEPATPVQTVSGGPVTGGEPVCAGWPAHAPTASLPVSFVPVAVERCVNGAQTIPGKGLWQTASLQRADSDLDALVSALHQPPSSHQPGTECPALAMIPPQVLLISATGQELIPRLPVSGCDLIQSQVLAALDTLPWRLVSVRLIAKIPGASASGTVP
jgi:hypothetical protein